MDAIALTPFEKLEIERQVDIALLRATRVAVGIPAALVVIMLLATIAAVNTHGSAHDVWHGTAAGSAMLAFVSGWLLGIWRAERDEDEMRQRLTKRKLRRKEIEGELDKWLAE